METHSSLPLSDQVDGEHDPTVEGMITNTIGEEDANPSSSSSSSLAPSSVVACAAPMSGEEEGGGVGCEGRGGGGGGGVVVAVGRGDIGGYTAAGTKRPIATLESLPPINRDGRNLSEKKLRRLEKNRLSARECRRKKREAAQHLEREINVLEAENLRLRLQLQIGEEAEQSSWKEQERVTEGLDALLKSGASEGEIYAQIEEFKEKFADYGRDRRTAIEFHLRNVARLLMPTTTTSVAMRALQGGPMGISGSGLPRTVTPSAATNSDAAAPLDPISSEEPSLSSTKPSPQTTPAPPSSSAVVTPTTSSNGPISSNSSAPLQRPPLEPKALFRYLVNYLEVTPDQAAALKDSRSVAKELDSSLQQALAVHDELRQRLTQVGEDLEAEMNSVRAILTPTQAAKFLVWVANNGSWPRARLGQFLAVVAPAKSQFPLKTISCSIRELHYSTVIRTAYAESLAQL